MNALFRVILVLFLAVTTTTAQTNPLVCQEDADCHNGGCIKMQDQPHYCRCEPGFGGKVCAEPCNRSCLNFGSCRFRMEGRGIRTYCECLPHQFTGEQCEIPYRTCPGKGKVVKCLWGGTCQRETNGYVCKCPKGRSGTNCELEGDDPAITTSSATSSNNNKEADDSTTIRNAVVLFMVALAGAGLLTVLTMCWFRPRQPNIDTKVEEDIASSRTGDSHEENGVFQEPDRNY